MPQQYWIIAVTASRVLIMSRSVECKQIRSSSENISLFPFNLFLLFFFLITLDFISSSALLLLSVWPPSLTFFKIISQSGRASGWRRYTHSSHSTDEPMLWQSSKCSAFIFCAEGKLCFNYITEFQKFRPRCGDPAIECECRRFTSLGCTARAFSLSHSLLDNAQSELYHSPIFNFFYF